MPKLLIVLAFAAVMALWGPSPARAETDVLGGVEIVSAEELDAARGGYKAGTDLMFSFGIEKAVYVNGVLEATSSLNLMQAGGAGSQLSQVPFPGTLIQLGMPGDPGIGINSSAISPDSFRGIILQNSLNNQWITNVTKISVGLNVLGAYRENNLSAILSQQQIRSLR
ncbi:hypothetical protein [Candidatus Deferrimicrobium sp.]|uniref:hypothetical protein n=1 Tax=Candidatus Deferrimicrobium sp. TaxID=3060586 RepID=UPI003C653B63